MLRKAVLFALLLPAALAVSRQEPSRPPAGGATQAIAALPGTPVLQEGFEEGLGGWSSRPEGGVRWIQDAGQAHSGRGAALGKVVGDQQANFFARGLRLDKSSLYYFVCWVRSDNPRGKFVLYASQGENRRMLGTWQNVGRSWTRYECQFSIPGTGEWQLQLILPSSHGAPPCSMWLDDVRVIETRMPEMTNLTQGKGYSTEPSLTVDGRGTLWVSWLSHQDGRDRLHAGRLSEAAGGYAVTETDPLQQPKGSYTLGSTLVPDREGAWLVYASEVDKNWDIYACRINGRNPGEPRRVTSDAMVDAKPAAAIWRDELWLAWESNRDGARQVFAGLAGAAQPRRLSQPGVNSYSPAVVAHAGDLWVAWHAYVDGNYDLYGCRLSPGGEPGPIVRLTRDAEVDRHAQLLSCGAGLWIAWQKELMPSGPIESTREYRTGMVTDRQTWLCRWSPGGLEAASGLDRSILRDGTEMPTLAADAQGRIWVTARRARGKSRGWDSVLQCFAGSRWGEAKQLSTEPGWDGRAAIAVRGGSVLVAYQAGATPAFKNVEESAQAASDIYLGEVRLDSAPGAAPPEIEQLVEDTRTHKFAALRNQLGEQTERQSIDYRGEKLQLYWGDLHEHTSISICQRWKDTSPEDNYANERDIVHADFSAMTDHGYNYTVALWNHMSKIVRVNHDPGRFVTFLAEEWTSSVERYSEKYPAGFYGHRNLIFASPYFPRWYNAKDESTPRQIWEELWRIKADYVTIPHQLADTGNVPVDWDFTEETVQPVAEIFQARQSYEHKDAPRQAERTIDGYFLQDAWAKGILIGVIASPDHGGGQGKAAVWASELSREAVLDALRKRRCYGTSAARIFLDVRVNGSLMGEEITVKRAEPIVVTAKVVGAGPVGSIELCRNNSFIYSKPGAGAQAGFSFTDMTPAEGRSYYYVRVQQQDGELAWSSPVWVTRQ